jgi:predicted 3-demethylubiquinone-9 3-methyltransferase (glyoxalase superfamily)
MRATMEASVFIGAQASGKSTFYARHVASTRLRLSRDMLRTAHRLDVLFHAALAVKQPLVLDNTHPARASRARYVDGCRAAGHRVLAYWFDTTVEAALARNEARAGSARRQTRPCRCRRRGASADGAETFDEPRLREPSFVVTVGAMDQKVKPFLMFEGKAEEAMSFYVSLFPGGEIIDIVRYGAGGAGPEGSVMQARFSIGDQTIMCIDSPVKHGFTFTPSFSLFVECESEEELQRLYTSLAEGGKALMPLGNYGFSRQFGWLDDRYGVSWQLNLR